MYVKPQISFSQGSGKIDISVGARASGGRPVENVRVHVPLPGHTMTVNVTVNVGSYEYDPTHKVRSCAPISGTKTAF